MVAVDGTDRKAGRDVCRVVMVALLLGTGAVPARASGVDDMALDAGALQQMEQRAASANPRDQCFLYAEVVQGFTDLAGRQMAAGEEEQATATMQHVDEIAVKLHQVTAKDAKRLKMAEEMMDRTTRHLADMVRVASAAQRANMQHTLQHLNLVHSELLATVFAR
jgi:predicted alpha-1,6-mannanase (GH76 family)